MSACFVYRKNTSSSQMTLFSIEDINAEDYRAICKSVGAFEMLYLSRSHHIHPFGHKESHKETDLRTRFNIEQWLLVAAVFDPNHRAGFSSVFLVNKENHELAYVIEMTGFQVTDSIYGEWAIEDEDAEISMVEALDFFGIKKAVAKPAEEPKEQPSSTYEPIAFTANSSKKPRNLDAVPSKPQAPSPKPSTPKVEVPLEFDVPAEADEEDDEPVSVSVETFAFTPGSSKKPRNLDERAQPKKKPQPVPVQPKPQEKKEPEIVKVAPVQTPAFTANSSKKPRNLDAENFAKREPISKQDDIIQPATPAFSPVSQKKPKNLNESASRWQTVPLIRLYPDNKSAGAQTLVYDRNNDRVLGIFQTAYKKLGNLKSAYAADNCVFSPSIAESTAKRRRIKNFHIEEWTILAMNIDAYNRPTTIVLSYIEDPAFCIIMQPQGKVVSIGFTGVCINNPYTPFDELLERLKEPPKEEVAETPIPPKEEPLPEVEEPEAIEEDEVPQKKEQRRVFVTNSFLKAQERFTRKYHMQAERDFEAVIRDLLTMDEDELAAYLRGHDSKPISTSNGVTILKMRFGTSADYEASRLFYCRGYDFQRKMDSSDLLLLGLTDQGEHEEQGEASRLFARMFQSDNDLVLFRKLLPATQEENLDQLAYMSRKQFSYLDEARESMPMAFLGSAGTGKTLLSLQHYLSLLEEGRKVLYLTYQKALCDEVRKTLKELNVQDIEAMTYRDLCFAIFGEEKAREMRTKKRFRNWFMDYARKTGKVQSKLRSVGPTLEDQFMICYVFYRGIIDGSRRNYEKRRGAILSREDFLDEVRNEKGLSPEAKQTVYDVAVAYEKHLDRRHGTTDNKLAYEILSMGKKVQRYDAVVIDEFQDLSEIQFMAVASLLKKTFPLPLFIYGDENQAINPTIFGFSDAQDILFQMFGGEVRFQRKELTDSFRSGPNLVHYINDVNQVKRRAIGARSQQEEVEVSLREDEEDLFASLVEGKKNLRELVKLCGNSDKDVVFIFPSVMRKEEAEQEYASLDPAFVKSSFLSVEEAKGREWDSVVLVDFFSSSSELFDAMLGQERIGHQSTVHRMLFNRFYVALTRAENRIVVFESNVSDLIRKKLLRGLTPLKEVSELQGYFQGDASAESWHQFGDKLMHSRRYAAAYKAFSHCENDEVASSKAALCYRYLQAEQDEFTYEEARDLYLEQLDYEKLLLLYEEQGLTDHVRFIEDARGAGDPEYLREAYGVLAPTLSPLERKVFFSLCCRKLQQRIERFFAKLTRRHG